MKTAVPLDIVLFIDVLCEHCDVEEAIVFGAKFPVT